MIRILWFAGALVLAACSQSAENQRAGDETGGLRVSVHDLTEAEVKEVHIDLLPDHNAPNPAPAELQIVLRSDDPGVRDDSGAYVVWSWSETELAAGAYLVSAKAYDQLNPQLGFGVLPTFESAAVPAQVQASPTATVSLFLRQGVSQGDFEPPYVTAIRFDQKPEQAAISRISVWGDGGEGALSLEAAGPGDLGLRGPPATWDGKGDGDARDPGGAYIDWNPDASGELALSLILEDADGNRSTLVLLVDVDEARGDMDFALAFNHAPWSLLQSDSLVNPPTASITLTARHGDVESDTAEVDYKWDVSDCEALNFISTPASTGGVVSGSVVGDESDFHELTLSLTATPFPDPPPTCEVILEVSDRGLPGDATAVSTSTRSILVTLGEVHPCIGELSACGGVCVDLQEDNDNCGACGNVCGVGQTCTAGACLCDDEGLSACGQLCVDLQNDDEHCGACDAACGAGLVCEIAQCDFASPAAGVYAYETTVINSGITNPMHGAWHPSGAYALIAEGTNRVFKYVPNQEDPINPTLTLLPEVSGVAWNGITFLPDGAQAILYGERSNSASPHTGYIYVWDHATEQISLHADGEMSDSRIKHHTWAPDGSLWLLGWNGRTSTSGTPPRQALVYEFDLASGPVLRASGMHSTSAACTRMAWSTDHLGKPLIVILCDTYGETIYPGNSFMEPSTSLTVSADDMKGRPQGDYALVLPPSGSTFRRFENGAWSTQSVVSSPARISYSPTGKRALLLGTKSSTNPGRVWEYRHPLLNSANVGSVDIPYANFIQDSSTVTLNDAVWKRDCDEGIILGGNTGTSASGYIIEFKVTNGRACPP